MLSVFRQINFYLARRCFRLLQADDVGVVRANEPRELAFVDDGADTVDVPREEFHGPSIAYGQVIYIIVC